MSSAVRFLDAILKQPLHGAGAKLLHGALCWDPRGSRPPLSRTLGMGRAGGGAGGALRHTLKEAELDMSLCARGSGIGAGVGGG